MTIPTPPYAALDGILRRATHLILDFDGPVCALYAHKPPDFCNHGGRYKQLRPGRVHISE